MRRATKTTISALSSLVFASFCLHVQGAPTIYKHIDESGRITYSNAPIKGAEKVDLQPITVLPAMPPSAATAAPPPAAMGNGNSGNNVHNGNLAVARITPVPRAVKAVSLATANAKPEPGAKLNYAPAPAPTIDSADAPTPARASLATLAPDVLPAAALATAAPTAPSPVRKDDVQRRNLQHTLLGEQESLANAKAQLAEESKQSASIRALRASFNTVPAADQSGIRKIVTPEMRAQVERHFERIRDLQDEIVMHERNVAELRSQLRAEPAAGVVAVK